MKVSELIEKLQKLDQDALVVMNGYDHSYEKIYRVTKAKAEMTGEDSLYDYDERYGQRTDVDSKVVDVVVIM